MYGCESWTIKKAERWRIDAFELWCWRRLLRVPWTTRRSNLSVHWKDWCWSWNSITLATSCKELTHLKRPWCWERLKAGGEGNDRGWDGWMASLTQWTWVWASSGRWWRDIKTWCAAVHRVCIVYEWATEQQQDTRGWVLRFDAIFSEEHKARYDVSLILTTSARRC